MWPGGAADQALGDWHARNLAESVAERRSILHSSSGLASTQSPIAAAPPASPPDPHINNKTHTRFTNARVQTLRWIKTKRSNGAKGNNLMYNALERRRPPFKCHTSPRPGRA